MATTVDLGNVIGPQGPQGVQGIQGPKGETGPAGANWYVFGLYADTDAGPGKFLFDVTDGLTSNINDVFNNYPYVVCRLRYDNHLLPMFVPTAYYEKRNTSTNKYEKCIQFSCLTLKGTAGEANNDPSSYYNCIVICEDGTITGSVRAIDPAAEWHNIINKPFNDVDTGILSTNAGTLSINMDIIYPNYTLGQPAHCDMDYSLAIGSDAVAGGSYDVAIGPCARTIRATSTDPNNSIAIGNTAVCDVCTDCIAIGTNAHVTNAAYGISLGKDATCKYENSVALGANSEVYGERQVSVGSLSLRRRISYVDTPSDPLDAVNMSFVTKNTPKIIKLCSNVKTSAAALDTNKTFAGFQNISITQSTYNLVSTYIKDWTFIPEAIIFETIGSSTRHTKRQVFTVSQCQHIYVNDTLNLNLLADCFVNFGMITNASNTMLNLARVELSMSSKTEIMMNVSSASAMGIDKNSTYGMYLYLKPGK